MYIVKKLGHYSNYSVNKHIKMEKMKIEFYHLVFMLKGEMTYIINGTPYTITDNDAILIPPGSIRERECGQAPSKYIIFNFNTYENTPIKDPEIVLKNAISPNIKKLLTLYPYKYDPVSSSTTSREIKKTVSILYNILNCILIELLDTNRYDTRNPHVLRAITYINDHIMSPISLNEVSEAIHISKEYTAKIFKEETGKTVSEYINEQKMNIAKDMLSSNEVSLRDTALSLGYENYSYFSRVFKKHFNMSPTKIKNSLNQ